MMMSKVSKLFLLIHALFHFVCMLPQTFFIFNIHFWCPTDIPFRKLAFIFSANVLFFFLFWLFHYNYHTHHTFVSNKRGSLPGGWELWDVSFRWWQLGLMWWMRPRYQRSLINVRQSHARVDFNMAYLHTPTTTWPTTTSLHSPWIHATHAQPSSLQHCHPPPTCFNGVHYC